MSRSIRIVVGECPENSLLPNQRRKNHWRITASASANLRKSAQWEAATQKPQDWDAAKYYTAVVTVQWPRTRYPPRKLAIPTMPDLDGVLNACKPIIDGLEDAGVIEDDKYAQEYTVRQCLVDDPNGSVIIDVTRVG